MTTEAGRSFLGWWMRREYVTVTLDFADVSVAAIEAESFAAGRAAALGEVREWVGDRMSVAMLGDSEHDDGMCAAYDLVFDDLDRALAHPAEAEPEERADAD